MDDLKQGDWLYSGRWGFILRNPKCAFRYRLDPVPGVHKYGHGGWFRNPHTKQERSNRWIPESDEVYELLTAHQIKQLEKVRDLPSDYDDIPRSRKGNSWKNYRQTRYR